MGKGRNSAKDRLLLSKDSKAIKKQIDKKTLLSSHRH